MIDFSNCRIVPGRAYNGANGSKIAIEYKDHIYMLKFPPSAEGKPTELSYTNSCISEHIASSIFNMLDVKAHETVLGTYDVKGIIKTVCACRDFTEGGKRFLDFCSIKNTIVDSDSNGSGTELEDILDTIDRQQFVAPNQLKKHFWNMFIVDALLGNFDRHNGNWGFLYDENENITEIAPVYDCGSCLLPQADEKVMRKVLAEEAEMNARVYQFPTSAIKFRHRKLNYYDYLVQTKDSNCREALLRIKDKVDLKKIDSFIEDVEGITDIQKEFYKKYVSERYSKILCHAAGRKQEG